MRPPLTPAQAEVFPQGGMDETTQRLARESAVAGLERLLAGERGAGNLEIRQVVDYLTGSAGDEYLALVDRELGIAGDATAPDWAIDEVAPGTTYSVVVIGAGMTGIAMSYRLHQAGIEHVVLEEQSDVGGTWRGNRYPGVRLDTNNFAYSYSFLQKSDWPNQFSEGHDIWDYFSTAADELGVRERVRTDTRVERLELDESTSTWTIHSRHSDGSTDTLTADAVITAVGQLNRPKLPDVPGIEDFAGTWCHTAEWTEDVRVSGERVALVGSGASAYQVVPAIVDDVSELVLFQRTPPWMLPTPAYHDPIKPGMAELLAMVPGYSRWFRFWQSWLATEGRLPLVTVDPSWDRAANENTVSAANLELRRQLVDRLEMQYADRPDLLPTVTPSYPPGGKRMLRDNGVWARALKSPHASVVNTPIERIVPEGIRTTDGVVHEVDVIVYATGFQAAGFLEPMEVVGRDGRTLRDFWHGDAAAYKGTSVPGFPGLHILFGPNTNLVVTGSAIFMSECSIEYVMECLRTSLLAGAPIEVTTEAYERYRDWVDAENSLRAWGTDGVTSWYKNAFGRVSQNWPFPLLTYFDITRRVDIDDHLPTAQGD